MQRFYKKIFFRLWLLVICSIVFISSQSFAGKNPYGETGFNLKKNFKEQKGFGLKPQNVKSVQLEADQVQFSPDTNVGTATGHVVVTAEQTILYADQVELQRSIGEAVASGHVYIDSPQMQIDADKAKFNFNNHTGEFQIGRVFNDPFQIKGKSISKVSDNHMVMQNGYLTTCDLDEPHFRMAAHRMDVYSGDKAIAKGVTMYLGKMPVMYLLQYVQDLKNRPIFTVTPGYKKDFGAFLLTTLTLKVSNNVKLIVHGDFRERLGLGEGVDVKYQTPRFGSGILRTYYTHEREIASHHLWNLYNSDGTKMGPTIRHERYRVEWRHQWQIDKDTNAIWQYYKVHDYDLVNTGFIKRYFLQEYRRGPDVNTYFVLTRNFYRGTLTYRIDASRVNHDLRTVERLPEIQYQLSAQQLGRTNFYLKTTDTFSNLQNDPNNGDIHTKTMRVDTNNEISYHKKVAFIELRPWVGGEHTYYSRTVDLSQRSIINGQFKTGSDLTTHFYRVWNYHTNFGGLNINGLRHVITPSAIYLYAHRPAISISHFNQFDGIDGPAMSHNVHLSLENKLQTKRSKQSVDLIRTIVETDYGLISKFKGPGRTFGPVQSTVEVNPNSWLSFKADQLYDNKAAHWLNANFDTFINGGDKWSLAFGKRYARRQDDQFTSEITYKINPKWRFKIYDRFIVDKGTVKEEDYLLTRDLHEWEMDIDYHQERGAGAGFFVVFRLKAFPNMTLNLFNNSFHRPKAGSQSPTEQNLNY